MGPFVPTLSPHLKDAGRECAGNKESFGSLDEVMDKTVFPELDELWDDGILSR